MNLIRAAIDRPTAVVAAVLLIILFGLVALTTIPIQLAPDVNRPVITVTTNWFGAAPAEIERELVNQQEDEFAGLEGLESITSRAQQGQSRISLEFKVGTNMDRALLWWQIDWTGCRITPTKWISPLWIRLVARTIRSHG